METSFKVWYVFETGFHFFQRLNLSVKYIFLLIYKKAENEISQNFEL